MKENKPLLTGILLGAIVAGALMYFFMQQRSVKEAEMLVNQYEEKYAALIDSVRQHGLVSFMTPLLEKIEEELDQSEERILSDRTISQIRALSDGFKPYAVFKRDQLSSEVLSPERGHLLRLLLGVNMDSSSWQKILKTVTFQNADLTGASLEGVDLSHADLAHASFKDADLTGAVCVETNLRETNFFGANLEGANLHKSNMTSGNFSWANLKGVNLSEAIMHGADFVSANIRHANLNNAMAERVQMINTFLDSSRLDDINLLEACLDQSHLREASFRGANLVLTTFKGVILNETYLDSAAVKSEQWFEKAMEWGVRDVDQLQKTYHIIKDVNDQSTAIRLIRVK